MTGPITSVNLNLKKMTSEDKLILSSLLEREDHLPFLFEHTPYNFHSSLDSNQYSVELSHNVMQTKNEGDDKSYQLFRFEDQIGDGGFSLVFKGDGSLKETTANGIDFKESNYVIKLQKCNTGKNGNLASKFKLFSDPHKDFNAHLQQQLQLLGKDEDFQHKALIEAKKFINEYDLTKASDTKIKQPFIVTIDPNSAYTFSAIEFIPGREFYDVIVDDENNKQFLSTLSRINITLQLLKSYKQHIYNKKIVHRDLKPENILEDLDPTTGNVKSCRIIDFNLSKWSHEVTTDISGSIDYLPPEAFWGANVDFRGDIFALGKIIAYVWRSEAGSAENAEEAFYNANHIDLTTLFSDIDDLTAEQKNLLTQIICGMTKAAASERSNIDELITLTETLKYTYILQSTDEHLKADIRIAESAAKEAILAFKNVARNATNNVDPFAQCKILHDALDTGVKKIGSHPDVLQYFLERIDIHLLKSATTQEEVLRMSTDLLNSIRTAINNVRPYWNIDNFVNECQKIKDCNRRHNILTKYQVAHAKLLNDLTQLEFTFDNLEKFNEKITKSYTKFTNLHEQLHAELNAQSKEVVSPPYVGCFLQARLFGASKAKNEMIYTNDKTPMMKRRV